jgi:glycosyltransferase involved in cell wall biosynthesis
VRVLILSPQSILAPKTGSELRNYHLARLLSAFLEVTYLCFQSEPASDAAGGAIRILPVPRPRTYTLKHLFRGLAGSAPIGVLNYASPAMAAALTGALARGRFDFVQIEGIQMTGYLPPILAHPHRPRAVICDWHNVESELMRRYSRAVSGIARKLYAWQTAAKLGWAERRLLRQPVAHLVVSERARAMLLDTEPGANLFVVENGVDLAYYSEAAKAGARRFRVLFVGAMDYHANTEAVERFARQVWPALHRAAPELVFTVVGRDPGPGIRALGGLPNVEVTGMVPDVRPYYGEALASVVPLRVGSGTRLKILESMAAGVPVVSTSLGAEGLRAQAGVHFLRADSPDEFQASILALRAGGGLARSLTAAAREMAGRNYDWSVVGAALRSVYEACGGIPGG